VIWLALWAAIQALLAFGLMQWLFPAAAALLRADAVSIADPAGLPVLAILFATVQLLLTPFDNAFTRWEEADADRFSLAVANEPDGLAKALVKTIAYRADSPSAVEEFLFYDHPSVRRRVQAAMDWKAAHPPAAGGDAPR
jgi:STE24 endopeptidase